MVISLDLSPDIVANVLTFAALVPLTMAAWATLVILVLAWIPRHQDRATAHQPRDARGRFVRHSEATR